MSFQKHSMGESTTWPLLNNNPREANFMGFTGSMLNFQAPLGSVEPSLTQPIDYGPNTKKNPKEKA